MMLGGVAGALVVLVCPTWLGVVVVVATAVFVIVDAIILARRLGAMELRPDDSEDDA